MILLPVPGEMCVPVFPTFDPSKVFLCTGPSSFRYVKEEPRRWWERLLDQPPRLTLKPTFYEDPAHFAYIKSPYKLKD